MSLKLIGSAFLLATILLIQNPTQVSLASGSTIDGIVTDAYTNAPISLAEVSIGAGSTWFEHGLGSTTTDTNGRYSIRVPMSSQYHFIVHAKQTEHRHYRFYDHCWSRRTIPYASAIHANFALEPAGSIIVKIFDLNGRPLGANSMEGSWVKDISLTSLSGESMDNRTYGHAYQPYRTDDEEVILLSPEGLTTVVSGEIAVPSHETLTINNASAGFAMRQGELLVLNFNYEVANAVFHEFNSTSRSLFSRIVSLNGSAAQIATNLAQAQADHLRGDDIDCAAKSNAALFQILSLQDEIWLKISFVRGHPRLLFTGSDLEVIREKIKSGFPEKAWKSILTYCDKILTLPIPQLLPSSSCSASADNCWYSTAGDAVTRMQSLAFAYAVTNDTKYAAKAKTIMWTALSWASWIDPVGEKGAPGLLAGGNTAAVAIAYDWLFDYLTPEERAFVKEKVREKGAQPLYEASVDGIWWSQDSHSNWDAVTHGGLGLAGLVFLGDDPDASKWVRQATLKISKFYDSGGRNGGWGEGLGYWGYGLSHALLFTEALRRVAELDLFGSVFLRETLYFPIYLVTPGLKGHVNFEDSWLDVGWIAALTLRLSSEYEDGHGQMFFNMLWDTYGDDVITPDVGPFILIWYDESLKPQSLDDLPLSRLFEGLGWVLVRSGWGPSDILFASKSGPNWNHGHADQNNFVFEAFGEPLVVDLGYGYPSQQYWSGPLDFHQASVGHNVILVNGQGQLDPRNGWAQPPNGRIETFQTYEGFESYEYVVGDASAAYPFPVKFIRQVIVVQHRFLAVLDTLQASQPSRFQWLLHTTGEFNGGERRFMITRNGVLLDVQFLLPEKLDSHIYHDQNRRFFRSSHPEPVPRLEVSTQEPALTATFLAVLYPLKSGESVPKTSLTENATVWTLKVEDNATHCLYFNRTTSPPTFLVAISRVTSLQQTVETLLETARGLLEKAKLESFENSQAVALMGSAEFDYEEAIKANQVGDQERAAMLATRSISEISSAFTINSTFTASTMHQETTAVQTLFSATIWLLPILGVLIVAFLVLAILRSSKKRQASGRSVS